MLRAWSWPFILCRFNLHRWHPFTIVVNGVSTDHRVCRDCAKGQVWATWPRWRDVG